MQLFGCLCVAAAASISAYLPFVRGEAWYYALAEDGKMQQKEKCLGFCFYTACIECIVFSSLIADSLLWTTRLGNYPAFSGFLIGSWMATTTLGYVLTAVMNR